MGWAGRQCRQDDTAAGHRFAGRSLPLIVLTLLAGTTLSGAARAESLWQALQSANTSNPKLNAERSRAMAEGQKIGAARAGYWPTLSGNADVGYALNGVSKYANTRPYGAGLSLTQTLYNGGRNYAENAKADAEASAAVAAMISAEQQTLLDATQAYLSVLRERRSVQLRQNALSTMRATQSQASARQREGDLTRTSVDQTRARAAEAEANLAQAQADRGDAEAMYRMVIGHAPAVVSEPSLRGVALPTSLKGAMDIAFADNPKIHAALHANQAAASAVDAAKAGYLPTVALEGSYRRGYEDDNLVGQAGQNATVRLKMSVPIFNGGLTAAQVRQAEDVRMQRSYDVDDTRANVRRAVESAFQQHERARMRRSASARRVEASTAALKGLQIEFAAGNTPLYVVLDGRRDLVESQVALARADYDVTMSGFVLMAAIGRFDLERVHLAQSAGSAAAFGRSGRKGRAESIPEPVAVNGRGDMIDLSEAMPKPDKGTRMAAPLPKAAPLAKDGAADTAHVANETPADTASAAAAPAKVTPLFSFGFLKSAFARSNPPTPDEAPMAAPVVSADADAARGEAPRIAPLPRARPGLAAKVAEPASDVAEANEPGTTGSIGEAPAAALKRAPQPKARPLVAAADKPAKPAASVAAGPSAAELLNTPGTALVQTSTAAPEAAERKPLPRGLIPYLQRRAAQQPAAEAPPPVAPVSAGP